MYFIEVYLIYKVILFSGVQHSDPVVCVCVCVYIYIYFFFRFLFIDYYKIWV